MICSSCGENRAKVHPKPSRLMPGTTLLLCNACLEGKREPRAFVIIHGRANGLKSVSDYIKKRRYCGAEITAAELSV
jgi:hypothetical protein